MTETRVGSLNTTALDFLTHYAPEHYRDGDITVEAAANTWGLGRIQAARRLNALAKEGNLTKIAGAILPSGKSGTLYRLVDTYPQGKKP